MPIHIFKDREGFHVWTEIEGQSPKRAQDVQFGRCIGSDKELNEAIRQGEEELLNDLNQLALYPPAVIEEGQ